MRPQQRKRVCSVHRPLAHAAGTTPLTIRTPSSGTPTRGKPAPR
jgi:hypothetical protein